MEIFQTVLIVLIVLIAPRVMVWLSSKYKLFNLLGPVFLCYALGIIFSFVFTEKGIATTLSEVMVPIAIPLILFSSDIGSLKRLAKPALKSFILVIISVVAVSTLGFVLFRNSVDGADKISGMLVGLYTGGTPNLMAIGMALGLPSTEIGLANTADLISGGIYFCLLLTVVPRLFERVLPPFKAENAVQDEQAQLRYSEEYVPVAGQFTAHYLLSRIPPVLLSFVCVGAACGIALLFTGTLDVAIVMLCVTSFGIALSFVKKVRNSEGTFASGQYFIYMFSLAIGISFDYTLITKATLNLLFMLLFVQLGAVAVHLVLAKIAKIDAHTTLITSTAGIYGPAFVAPVADALKNKQVVLPGLICGIFGYAIGNYIGIGLAYLLGLFV